MRAALQAARELALDLVFRFRFSVLGALLILTLGAMLLAFEGVALPVGVFFWGTLSLAAATLILFAGLRHFGLALTAALAPLPGMIAAGPLAATLAYSAHLAVYGFTVTIGACLAAEAVHGILLERERPEAVATALRHTAIPAGFAVLAGVIFLIAWFGPHWIALGSAIELAAASLSTVAFLSVLPLVLTFGEAFVVGANRARESRESLLAIATLVCEPRWALSGTGIAAVFVVLGVSGIDLPSSLILKVAIVWSGFVLLAGGLAWASGREWRDAFATALAIAVLAVVGVWLWGVAVGHLTPNSFLELGIVAALALFLMLDLLRRLRQLMDSGEAPAAARRGALEAFGFAPWFGVLAAGGAAFPWILLHGSIATLTVLFPLAGMAALLALPALATALESLIRRRLSVEQLYGRG
jgi:hypothetical protein